ncbi:MAG: InlB B-repeat-containing protein [Clostridia bacterium]
MKKRLLISILLLIAILILSACSQAGGSVYTITYHCNGGTTDTINPTAFNASTPSFNIYNPTREGYVFVGWSIYEDLSDPVLNLNIPNGSTYSRSYYAVWRQLARIDISIYGVSVFTVNTKTTYAEIGATASITLVLNASAEGTYVSWEYYDESLGESASTVKPAHGLMLGNKTILVQVTHMCHSIIVIVYDMYQADV